MQLIGCLKTGRTEEMFSGRYDRQPVSDEEENML